MREYNAPVTRVGRTPQAARDIPQSTTSITKLLMAKPLLSVVSAFRGPSGKTAG